LTADLLANDKGGAGKSFYSVDATTSGGTPIIYDQAARHYALMRPHIKDWPRASRLKSRSNT